MKQAPMEILRGSGNIYRDTGCENPGLLQFKAELAAEIIKVLDPESLSVREAQKRTGVPASDFSRIRTADLARFRRETQITQPAI